MFAMSLKKSSKLVFVLTIICLLSACNDGGKQYGKLPDHLNYGALSKGSVESERAYQTQQLYGPVHHDNQKMNYSQFLSNHIAAFDGVNTAIVMVTDHNAYVAILIDNTGIGTKGTVRETNNQGTNKGLYNPHAPDTDYMHPNSLNTGVNNYETARHHDLISHKLKQRIAEKIRYLQPQLMDVYISANRGFVNEMNNYAQESWKGNSLDPYLPKFNQLVTHVFGTEQVLPND
jgi:hypothetical protein